jgi:molybdate transport system permease protein
MAWPDLGPVWLTFQVAGTTVVVLLLIGTPIAWWLAFTRSRARVPIEAVVALPLVLPPTVLGFYLLLLLAPRGPVGSLWAAAGGEPLVFSFEGLVIGSVLYSLPFVVQPLQGVFAGIDRRLLEAAAALGAGRWRRFHAVVLPLSRGGLLTAATLGFAHTVGEFGVVLMLGGNVPGQTRVVSIVVYDHVEALEYADAHRLAALLLAFSFVALLTVYGFGRRAPRVLAP